MTWIQGWNQPYPGALQWLQAGGFVADPRLRNFAAGAIGPAIGLDPSAYGIPFPGYPSLAEQEKVGVSPQEAQAWRQVYGNPRRTRTRLRNPLQETARIGTELECPMGERAVRSPIPPYNWICRPFALAPCSPTEIPGQDVNWEQAAQGHEGIARAHAAGCRLFKKECGIPNGWIPSSTGGGILGYGANTSLACPPTCAIGIDDEKNDGCPPGQVVDLTDPDHPCVDPCPPGMGMTSLKPWGVPDPWLRDICCPKAPRAQRPGRPQAEPTGGRLLRRARARNTVVRTFNPLPDWCPSSITTTIKGKKWCFDPKTNGWICAEASGSCDPEGSSTPMGLTARRPGRLQRRARARNGARQETPWPPSAGYGTGQYGRQYGPNRSLNASEDRCFDIDTGEPFPCGDAPEGTCFNARGCITVPVDCETGETRHLNTGVRLRARVARGCPPDCGPNKVCYKGRCVPKSQVPTLRNPTRSRIRADLTPRSPAATRSKVPGVKCNLPCPADSPWAGKPYCCPAPLVRNPSEADTCFSVCCDLHEPGGSNCGTGGKITQPSTWDCMKRCLKLPETKAGRASRPRRLRNGCYRPGHVNHPGRAVTACRMQNPGPNAEALSVPPFCDASACTSGDCGPCDWNDYAFPGRVRHILEAVQQAQADVAFAMQAANQGLRDMYMPPYRTPWADPSVAILTKPGGPSPINPVSTAQWQQCLPGAAVAADPSRSTQWIPKGTP